MKKRPIVIAGPIGTFTIDGKEIVGMSLLDLVVQVNAQLDEDTTELYFEFESGGGADKTGKAMYNYLMSLKPKGIRLIGNQVGMIGSTATRPWFAMDERIALDDGTKNFLIHNPWLPPGVVGGTQADVQAVADAMKAKEDEFREFYIEHTGVTAEGLGPLMDDQTGFDAPKAVSLKFATSTIKSYNIAAYKMKPKNKVLQILEELALAFKSEKDSDDGVVALIIELEDGQKVSAPIEDVSKLVAGTPIFTVDEQGVETQVPVDDKDYVTKDGMKFTITDGKLAADPVAKPADEPADEAVVTALASILEEVKKQKPISKEDIKELIAAELTEFRKTVKTTFTPPKKASEDRAADALEYDRSFKANEHTKMKKEDPERYATLFHAKYGRLPN